VLVLSGRSGSGKSRFAKQLVAMHGDWALASCGDFVKDQAAKRQVDGDQRVTDRLGQTLVEELGAEGFLEAVLEHAEVPAGTRTLVIEDVYHVTVFDAIKRYWGHLRFISAELPESMRARVLHDRGLDSDAIEQVEHGHLDHAVEELERTRPPERWFEVPCDEGQLEAVSAEINDLLAHPA
jgi:adenylate kinase family enzyme